MENEIKDAVVEEKTTVKKEKKAEVKRGDTYKNIADCGVFICGVRVNPQSEYTLSDADKAQDRYMIKIKSAIKLGLIKKV